MEQELLKLGFTRNQAKVYLVLLELGRTTVGPIIKKTNLPRQTVYNTLAEMESKDLVFSVIKSSRANWQTKEPRQILDNIGMQKKLAEKILPLLLAKRDMAKHSAEIKVYEGIDGYMSVHMTNLSNQVKNSEVNIIGAAGQKWIDLAIEGNFFYKYEKIRIEKNISQKIIGYENQRKEVDDFTNQYYLHQLPSKRKKFRFLPEEFYSLVGIQIWQDRIELIIHFDYPIIFEIKSLQIVRGFEKYFLFLWNLAKK